MGSGTGLSRDALSCPVMFASEINSGGSGGNCDFGSRRDLFEELCESGKTARKQQGTRASSSWEAHGGAKPAIPEPSNIPDTDVTQQNGENEPYLRYSMSRCQSGCPLAEQALPWHRQKSKLSVCVSSTGRAERSLSRGSRGRWCPERTSTRTSGRHCRAKWRTSQARNVRLAQGADCQRERGEPLQARQRRCPETALPARRSCRGTRRTRGAAMQAASAFVLSPFRSPLLRRPPVSRHRIAASLHRSFRCLPFLFVLCLPLSSSVARCDPCPSARLRKERVSENLG
eukprot:1767392-Rhodomonas_salina.3